MLNLRLEKGLAGGLLLLRDEPRRHHCRGYGTYPQDGGEEKHHILVAHHMTHCLTLCARHVVNKAILTILQRNIEWMNLEWSQSRRQRAQHTLIHFLPQGRFPSVAGYNECAEHKP